MKVKNLIIGGGLSGLSLAYFLQEQKKDDYLILEKDSTIGGYCRTIPHKEYVWDYAGHFYHFQNEKYKNLFLSMIDPEEIVYSVKNTKIYFKDKLINYPFQMNIHELEKSDFIDCLYDLFTKDSEAKYDNFLDMLYAKFGKSITEKFLRPYNEKLYATDLHTLDINAMGRFFPYADINSIIRNMKEKKQATYNDTFMYLKKGTGYFIDLLAAKLDQSKIQKNTSVIDINIKQKIIKTNNGETIEYQNLINTAPFNQFLRLTNNQTNVKLSEKLSYNKVLVFNLGFDQPSPRYKDEHWVYFPDKTLNFYRIGFYNNILKTNKLSLYVEIGFPKDQKNINLKQELEATLSGLKKVGIINDKMKLVDYSTVLMDPAYVHISTSDNLLVEETIRQLEKEQIFNLGRYGRWTYNSMEDCMILSDKLSKNL